MPHRQDLYLKLAKARQALQQAQSQVVELEAQLFEGQPNHIDLASSEHTYYHPLDALVTGCEIIGFDWHYLYINDAAIRHEQRTKAELLGCTIMERHPGIEKIPGFAVLQRCMRERSVERAEHEVIYADGSTAWLELLVQPVPEGIFILSQEITTRKHSEQALLEREQQFRLFMEHAPAALAMLDNDMRYLLVSHRWLTDYRLSETDVIGRSHYDLFPDLPERWKEIHQRCLAGAVESSEADPFPRADGSLDWVRWEIHPWRKLDGAIGGLLILSEVITERKRAEERIHKLYRTLGVLSDINQAIVRIRHLPTLFEKVCAIAVEKGAFRMAWIGLFDPKTTRVNPVTYAGISESDLEKLINILHAPPLSRALRAGERLICNDIQNDPRWLAWREEALRLKYRATVVLPLVVAGELRGIFNLSAGETGFFDEQEMRLMDEMVGDIAFAIEVAEQEVQRLSAEAAVKRYAQRMEILHQIDTAITNANSTEAIVEAVLQSLRRLIPCQRANVGLLDMSQRTGVIFAVDYDGDTTLGQGLRIPIAPDFFDGYDARHVKVVPDLRVLQATNPHFKQAVNEGLLSGINVILMRQEKPLGTLGLFASTPDFFTTEHQEILIDIGNRLTIAIHQQDLYEALLHYAQTQAEERQFLETIFDAFPANCAVLNAEGAIIRVNAQWKQFAEENDAHSETHYLGTNYLAVCEQGIGLMANEAALVAAGIRAIIAGEQEAFSFEYPCHSSTTERWFSLRVTPFAEPTPRRVLVAHVDTTARKKAEDAERSQRVIAEALRNSLAALATLHDVEAVMQEILKQSATVIPSEAGTIILFEGNRSYVAYSRGFSPEAEAFFKHHQFALDEGLFPTGYGEDDHYLVADTSVEPRWISYPGTDWIRASLGVSILLHGKPIGSLVADSATPNQFQKKDIDNFRMFARYAALALESAQLVNQLEQKVAERTVDLQTALMRVEAILNHSPDAILLANDALRIQQVNASFNHLFDSEWDEYSGKSLLSLVHSDDTNNISNLALIPANQQNGKRMEICAIRKDGAIFDAELNIGVIEDNGLVCIIRDITERKRAAEALQKSATEIYDLYNNAPCGYHSIDKDGLIVQINDTELRWLGYTRDEVMGRLNITALLTPESVQVLKRTLPILFERGWINDVELDLIRKDGSIMHILLNATAIYDNEGQYLKSRSTLFDITELQQAQQAVVEKETRYRLLAENISDVIAKMNPEGIRTFITPSCYALLGYTPAELVGQPMIDIVHPEDRPDVLATIMQAIGDQKATFSFTRRFRHKAGHDVWVEVTNNPIYDRDTEKPLEIIGVLRDITERKRSEEALRMSEGRYRLLAENIADIIMTFSLDRLITYMSPSCEKLLGYLPEEVEGKSHSEFIHPEDYPQVVARTRRAVVAKEDFYTNQFRLRHKTGHYIWYEVRTRLVFDANTGNVVQFISILRDITERKRANDALRESEERFRRAIIDAPFPIMIHADNGEVLHISNVWTEISGYTHSEIPTMSDWIAKAYGANSQTIRPLIEQVYTLTKPRRGGEFRIHTKAGEERIWDFISAPLAVMPDGRRMVSSMAMDITERKHAEAALQKKIAEEHQFQVYLKALHEIIIELTKIDQLDTFYKRAVALGRERLGFERLAMFLYDARDDTAIGTYGTNSQGQLVDERGVRFRPDPNGVMQRSFERVERFYLKEETPLYNDEEPVGYGWNAAAVLWNGTRSLGWFVADNLLSREPASKPLLDILGLYALSVGPLLAQKQTQLALKESEALYRLLAENISDLIMRSTLTSECLYISHSVETLLGYTPEELIGQQTFSLIHPDDQVIIWEAYAAALERHEPILPHQYRARHKAGHYIWLETVGKPIFNEASTAIDEVITSSRDITSRKQSEEALRESEEKFRLLLDAAPVATVISDQTGRISLVNGQAEHLFGYGREELIGRMVELLVPDYARAGHENNRMMYVAAPRVRPMGLGMALYARRKDGSEIPVEIELSYIETQQGMMVMSFIMDITERKRVAAELEQQRSFLRNVIDVSPSIIFVKDYDGRFVLVNPSLAAMYNTTIEALVGKTDADFSPIQQEVDDFLAADRRVITSGEMLFVEEPLTNSTGEMHWLQTTKVPIISADGQAKYVLGVATDITKRKEAEAALRESEEKYRSLVKTMRGGLAVFDLEFRVTFVNDRFCELLGYSSEEVIGKQPMNFVDAPDIPLVQAHLERRQSAESTAYEVPLRHKDGHPIQVLLSGSPLLDKQGQYAGSIVVATDISLQKQAEATLRQALAKEKELGDLKTRFVSMASHEFRTPLASILALVETLSVYRKKLSEEQIEQRFTKIKVQIGHLKDIMEDVLMLARLQARRVEFNPVKLDLDALCRSVLDEFQSQGEVKHRLEYSVSEGIHEVLLDQKLIRQIINNLVSNAVKYSPSATPIGVTLTYTADSLILRVADEGIGIPETDLPHLFEPFHRAANVDNISGTGLGLVITKEAVELHSGTITVESQQGIGTTFIIRIPIPTGG